MSNNLSQISDTFIERERERERERENFVYNLGIAVKRI